MIDLVPLLCIFDLQSSHMESIADSLNSVDNLTEGKRKSFGAFAAAADRDVVNEAIYSIDETCLEDRPTVKLLVLHAVQVEDSTKVDRESRHQFRKYDKTTLTL